jgi:hypothetical protein
MRKLHALHPEAASDNFHAQGGYEAGERSRHGEIDEGEDGDDDEVEFVAEGEDR